MRGLFLLLILVLCDSAEAQFLPHVTRTRRVCAISSLYDYEISRLSQPVSRLTFPGVPELSTVGTGSSVAATGGGTPVRLRVFPLRDKALTNGHCSVSKVVVTVAENGRWSVDLMAEQNPLIVEETQRAKFALFAQNRFHLTLRPLTAEAGLVPGAADAVAAPAVTLIRVKPFWVERGKSVQVRDEGVDERLAERFAAIKVIAVDLAYQ